MPRTKIEQIGFAVILCGYLLIASLFAIRTPAWQAPDEPAHYNYIAQVVDGTLLPRIEMGDWDNAYLETLKANGFAPEYLDRLATVQYEDHQPPLYYWLGAPIYRATEGNLIALRLYSVVLGAVTIVLTYASGRVLMPNHPAVALGAMALVAFIPQNVHMLASVNNDALVGVWIALLIYLLLRFLRGDLILLWAFGLLIGLIVITKTTGYFMVAVVFVAMLIHWWRQEPRTFLGLLNLAILSAPVALPFIVPYWGRNIFTYGFPDFLGLRQHDLVVVGQLRTADHIADIGFSAYLQEGIQTTFQSFWGQFGWMAAPMDGVSPLIYPTIAILATIAFVGLLLYLRQRHDDNGALWVVLGLVMALSMAQFLYYNVTFVQFQGRYIFAGIVPFALGFVTGLDVLRHRFFSRIAWWWVVLLLLGFAVLDAYLIWRVIPGALG